MRIRKVISILQSFLSRGEIQIVLFFMGFLLFTWPFLGTTFLSSIKGMYLYLYLVWGAIVMAHILAGIGSFLNKRD